MHLKYLYVLIFVCGSVISKAGEKHPLQLTGNPEVDFFGAVNYIPSESKLSMNNFNFNQDVSSSQAEKSPWLAGVLSLIVPGAGEVYSEDYILGAVFFTVEACSWVTAYIYDRKGDRQTDLFQDYANSHWNAVRYTNWTVDNLGNLNPNLSPPTTQLQYLYKIYGTVDPLDPAQYGPPFRCISWRELNQMERDIAEGQQNGYTHVLPDYGSQQYYELIGKYDQFSRGWDDSDPDSPLENNIPIHSTSRRFYQYALMRAKANDYYDVASTFVSIAIINHVVSALDAFWSASRFNGRLHAELQMRMQPTLFGSVPLTEAKIKYSF